ncbi:hypothetical protein TorRG33x02_060310 [Trema orientale]|uniref:Uncharacterized protein n=1 Tax=Trema orientale TaxID=63057 RepID=A0A2P5FK78_TREOI|nr:hypothetical protein TorRG33x02_060310 [Trema orientale]
MGPPESNQIDESRVWVGSGPDSGGVLGNGYAKILAESSAVMANMKWSAQSFLPKNSFQENKIREPDEEEEEEEDDTRVHQFLPFFFSLSVLNIRPLSRACVFTPLRINSSIVPIPMSQSARSTTLHDERQNLASLW